MHPAFSVILLTTLIGVGQGLFLALYAAQVGSLFDLLPPQARDAFYALGSGLCLLFLGGGLFASFFHLGHPERAWRTAAQWRTSWLSREVIVLPAFMGTVALYGAGNYFGWPAMPAVGALGAILALALFICTGMIYACIKFLQEWASPLTVVNYGLLGCASGFTLATAFSAYQGGGLAPFFGAGAAALTLLAFFTRGASLIRNSRLKPKSTPASAIGVRHPRIVQRSQGFMGGAFNTREFFHGRSSRFLQGVKWVFLALVFPLPLALLATGLATGIASFLAAAFAVQYLGLIAERWFFFAQANHPQNLYYQLVS